MKRWNVAAGVAAAAARPARARVRACSKNRWASRGSSGSCRSSASSWAAAASPPPPPPPPPPRRPPPPPPPPPPPAPPAPPAGEQHLHEVEPRRHVAGCALHDPAEVRLSGRGVELDQLVQRAQLARAAPQHAVHLAARLRRAAGQLVDFGERQSDVVARRVQCRRPPDLPLGLVVAALPQLHQSDVRVAQRLIGRQRDDLAKRRFRLSELLAPQVREAERPRREDGGVALEAPSHPLPPRRLPAAAGDEEQHGDDAKTRQGVPD